MTRTEFFVPLGAGSEPDAEKLADDIRFGADRSADELTLDLGLFIDSLELSHARGGLSITSHTAVEDRAGPVIRHDVAYVGSDGRTHRAVFEPYRMARSPADDLSGAFAAGTLIATPEGERAVETLDAGDLVTCGDGKHRPLRWVATRGFGVPALEADAAIRPVIIRENAFGPSRPAAPLKVSPYHRVVLSDWRVQYYTGEDTILVPIHLLVDGMRVFVAEPETPVIYHQLLFGSQQTLFANGIETEAHHPLGAGLDVLEIESREELAFLFPDLRSRKAGAKSTTFAVSLGG